MKKILKYKYPFAVLVLFLVILGGTYLYQNKKKEFSKEESAQKETILTPGKEKTTPDLPAENEIQSTKEENSSSQETTQPTTVLSDLKDVSLTVYKEGESNLLAYFYIPSGIYNVQKKEGSNWKNLVTNRSYPGHGGLAVPAISSSEATLRIVKIEGGKEVSVSKEFIMRSSDLATGVKTYN